MSFVPTFSNGVASATLDDNNVTVEIHRGYLSVYDNSTGSDACIFRYRLDEDRFQMGAIFQKFGLDFETRVVGALQHNPLWMMSAGFTRWLHYNGEPQAGVIHFFLDNATYNNCMVVGISIKPEQLHRLLCVDAYIDEDTLQDDVDLLQMLINGDPLDLRQQAPTEQVCYTPTFAPDRVLHGLGALYAMLMEVYVPCFKN
ncbi:hypothetical protein ABVT61_001937 [Salmonella enterica subsp. enterica serovar Newport]